MPIGTAFIRGAANLVAFCMLATNAIAEVPANTPLLGTLWRTVEIAGAPVPLARGMREPTLLLTAENKASGFAGCNRYSGGFEQGADSIRLLELASTMMACEPEAMELERSFLQALDAARSFKIVGEILDLLDGDGQVTVGFESKHQ